MGLIKISSLIWYSGMSIGRSGCRTNRKIHLELVNSTNKPTWELDWSQTKHTPKNLFSAVWQQKTWKETFELWIKATVAFHQQACPYCQRWRTQIWTGSRSVRNGPPSTSLPSGISKLLFSVPLCCDPKVFSNNEGPGEKLGRPRRFQGQEWGLHRSRMARTSTVWNLHGLHVKVSDHGCKSRFADRLEIVHESTRSFDLKL